MIRSPWNAPSDTPCASQPGLGAPAAVSRASRTSPGVLLPASNTVVANASHSPPSGAGEIAAAFGNSDQAAVSPSAFVPSGQPTLGVFAGPTCRPKMTTPVGTNGHAAIHTAYSPPVASATTFGRCSLETSEPTMRPRAGQPPASDPFAAMRVSRSPAPSIHHT